MGLYFAPPDPSEQEQEQEQPTMLLSVPSPQKTIRDFCFSGLCTLAMTISPHPKERYNILPPALFL